MPRLRWRSGLYAITDTVNYQKDKLLAACEAVLQGGAVVLQYRDKSNDTQRRRWEAKRLKQICDQYNVAFIINDDIDLCLDVDADGVHIGQHDFELTATRERVGLAKIIGVSCYNNIKKAEYSMQHGANYVAFGAFYPSATKPEAVKVELDILQKAQTLGIPVVAIGGINLSNATQLIQAGAHNLAVVSDLWSAVDLKKQAQAYQTLCESIRMPNFEQAY